MKILFFTVLMISLLSIPAKGQIWKDLKKKAEETVQGDSGNRATLSNEEVVSGFNFNQLDFN